MDDLDNLKRVLKQADTALPADDNARKRAVNLALAAFAEEQAKSKNITQGFGLWARLTGSATSQDRRLPMTFSRKKLVYGGLASVLVVVMAGGVSLQQMQRGTTVSGVISPVMQQTASSTVIAPAKQETFYAQNKDKSDSEKEMVVAGDAVANIVAPTAPPVMAQPEAKAMAESSSAPMMAKRMMSPSMGVVSSEAVADSMAYPIPYPMPEPIFIDEQNRDEFKNAAASAVKIVAQEPVSTFSADVDTASYSFVRKMIEQGQLPSAEAVRVEEMINYFDYNWQGPDNRETPFKATVSLTDSPWKEGNKLMTIGIKGYDVIPAQKPRSNIVLLLDTSGSMQEKDKLPLVVSSMKLLLNTLDEDDTVAITTYAGSAGTVLQPTKVADKDKIIAALENLNAGGSTAGAAGIEEAYSLAQKHFDEEGVNRVILATDGDFNVGISDPAALKKLIENKRESGIYLSVLGFGQGNLQDDTMQELAQNGNGIAAYIDDLNEAHRVLVKEASSTLFPIANDVKFQVEFNPATVAEYRLIGYETRALNREDFNNDKIDAGDIGSGHTVTAIYEITPVGGPRLVDDLRYQSEEKPAVKAPEGMSDEYAFVKMRYKLPGEKTSKLITQPVSAKDAPSSAIKGDVTWATAVAAFGDILRSNNYTGAYTLDDVLTLAKSAKGSDEDGSRAEFIKLVELAKGLK